MFDKEEWRLVILGRAGPEVLLVPNEGRYSLPHVDIPRWQRIAESVTAGVKECWNLDAICLFTFVGQRSTDSDARPRYYQVLASRSNGSTPSGLRWVNAALLCREDLTAPEDFDNLRHALSQIETLSPPGPFTRRNWFDELLNWIEPHLLPLDLTLSGSFKQFNASHSFSLIRFETNGLALWFKAVGEPNVQEFEITTFLARRHSRFFPRVIATHPEWHGWLMEEASGVQLNHAVRLEQWQTAVRALAALQKESTGESGALVRAGCRDRRIANLLDLVDPFLEVIAKLMQQQPKTPPAVLTKDNLSELGATLKSACAKVKALGIPETLGHCDFNPGNIIVTTDECIFLDWAEAYAGFPFATCEYLLAHLDRDHPERTSWAEAIREAYEDEWKANIPTESLREAVRIAPLLAAFVYASNGDAWQEPRRLQEPNFAKHMRSLSRRMYCEAQALTSVEVPCSSS